MCLPSLGTSEPTVRTSDWSDPWVSTLPYWAYLTPECATYVCVCLTSLPVVAPNSMGFADVGLKVLYIVSY